MYIIIINKIYEINILRIYVLYFYYLDFWNYINNKKYLNDMKKFIRLIRIGRESLCYIGHTGHSTPITNSYVTQEDYIGF